MLRYPAAAVLFALVVVGCGGGSASTPFTEGRDIYASNCSACHGNAGDGGTGPSLEDVNETFPLCDTHIEWVALGTEDWKQLYGDTYGATDKPITKVMPAHKGRLTPKEIALVAAFERIQYGGTEEAVAFLACGIDHVPTTTP